MKRLAIVIGLTMAMSVAGNGVMAQIELENEHAVNARAHAYALKTAYLRLEQFILRGSAGATSWTGDVPPSTTGWLPTWTDRGVRARYCKNASDPPDVAGTLVVYMGLERLMGVGLDQRSVQAAPRMYGGERRTLHWLEGGVAYGGEGRPTVALPACMSALVPSGRAALAGGVLDPWTVTRPRTRWESRAANCPTGMHRPSGLDPAQEVRSERRLVTEQVNQRDEIVGLATYGPWTLSVDLCVADYEVQETQNRSCTYLVNGQAEQGYEIWMRQRRVASGGTSGTWSLLFSTCTTGPSTPVTPVSGTPESLPNPNIWFVDRSECEPSSCPSGSSGSAERCRSHRDRYAQFPWDSTPTIQTGVSVTNWITDRSGCTPDDRGGGGGEGGGFGGDDGDGEGAEAEGGLGDGEDAASGGDGLGSETADPGDDGLGSMGGDGGGGGDGGC